MPDGLVDVDGGPDGMFDDGRPVSRGQWETIAREAMLLLGMDVPTSRFRATVATVRLKAARLRGDQNPNAQP